MIPLGIEPLRTPSKQSYKFIQKSGNPQPFLGNFRAASKRQHLNHNRNPKNPGVQAYTSDEGRIQGDEYDFQSNFEAAALKLQALEDYTILMQQPEPDTLMGAVLIAQHRHPFLEYDDIVEQLDDLAEQVRAQLPPEGTYPMKKLSIISDYLYGNRGFKGNADDYYDPDNSCINQVLNRRLGIPLTLALVYSEISKRLGTEVIGINIPGHFYLAPKAEELEFLIDVFEGGSIAFQEDAEHTLSRIYQKPVKLDPSFLKRKDPLPSRVFLTRMLNNLKVIYVSRKDWQGAYTCSCYLRATRPGDLEEIRLCGYYLWNLQRYNECAAALHEYINRVPSDTEEVSKVKRLLRMLKDIENSSSSSSDD